MAGRRARGGRARARRPARVGPGRGRRRLHARRRRGLARPPLRARRQLGHRRRARDGRGELVRADARDRARPLLGPPRAAAAASASSRRSSSASTRSTRVNAGWLIWPWEEARRVLAAWAEWTETVPGRGHLGRAAPAAAAPAPICPSALRGRQLVVVEAAILADEDEAARLLAPLRELGPEIDTFAQGPATALADLHMDPPEPVPAAADRLRHRRAPRRGRRRPGRRRRPGLGLAARSPSSSATSAAPLGTGPRRRRGARPRRRRLPGLRGRAS